MTNKLIIANWKMAVDRQAAINLAQGASAAVAQQPGSVDVILCAPHVYSETTISHVSNGVMVSAQDVAVPDHPKGAQTGDVSPTMLRDIGCTHVIIGHSERRARYHETDALVHAKIIAARVVGLTPIVCVGEGADDRAAGRAKAVVEGQIMAALGSVAGAGEIIIAYEPIWAIGGGVAATIDDITAMHHFIHQVVRKSLAHLPEIRMVYGGSVKPENVAAILAVPYVDGVLVGAASLDVGGLTALIEAGISAHNI